MPGPLTVTVRSKPQEANEPIEFQWSTPGPISLEVGGTASIRIYEINNGGKRTDITSGDLFFISNPDIVDISDNGTITARNSGDTEIFFALIMCGEDLVVKYPEPLHVTVTNPTKDINITVYFPGVSEVRLSYADKNGIWYSAGTFDNKGVFRASSGVKSVYAEKDGMSYMFENLNIMADDSLYIPVNTIIVSDIFGYCWLGLKQDGWIYSFEEAYPYNNFIFNVFDNGRMYDVYFLNNRQDTRVIIPANPGEWVYLGLDYFDEIIIF